jgi:NRPS condensation-like uncharacterized protein
MDNGRWMERREDCCGCRWGNVRHFHFRHAAFAHQSPVTSILNLIRQEMHHSDHTCTIAVGWLQILCLIGNYYSLELASHKDV